MRLVKVVKPNKQAELCKLLDPVLCPNVTTIAAAHELAGQQTDPSSHPFFLVNRVENNVPSNSVYYRLFYTDLREKQNAGWFFEAVVEPVICEGILEVTTEGYLRILNREFQFAKTGMRFTYHAAEGELILSGGVYREPPPPLSGLWGFISQFPT